MSKMGNELEKRLDENKYELYVALKRVVDWLDDGEKLVGDMYEIHSKAHKVLSKIEKGGE